MTAHGTILLLLLLLLSLLLLLLLYYDSFQRVQAPLQPIHHNSKIQDTLTLTSTVSRLHNLYTNSPNFRPWAIIRETKTLNHKTQN